MLCDRVFSHIFCLSITHGSCLTLCCTLTPLDQAVSLEHINCANILISIDTSITFPLTAAVLIIHAVHASIVQTDSTDPHSNPTLLLQTSVGSTYHIVLLSSIVFLINTTCATYYFCRAHQPLAHFVIQAPT